MIFADLRAYLKQNRQASLKQMSVSLSAEPEALRGMLDHLIAKGKVITFSMKPPPPIPAETQGCAKGRCKGCAFVSMSCTSTAISSNAAPAEFFQWVG